LTDLAVASDSVYLTTIDLPLTYTSLRQPAPTEAAGSTTGEVVALSLATGIQSQMRLMSPGAPRIR
jgi:hypothetical protein